MTYNYLSDLQFDLTHWWLIAISAALGFLVFSLRVRLSRLKDSQTELSAELTQTTENLSKALAGIKSELGALANGTVGLGKRLQVLEKSMRETTERQDILEMRESGDKQYNQAQHMIESGASIEEVVATCQISRTEAELMRVFKQAHQAGSGTD